MLNFKNNFGEINSNFKVGDKMLTEFISPSSPNPRQTTHFSVWYKSEGFGDKGSDFLHFINSNRLLKCKKSMSISIVALVILTLILTVLALYYFIISERQVSAVLNVPSEIDSIYDDSAYFNIYLTGMFDRAINGFKLEEGKGEFIERFKREVEKTLLYSKYGNTITYSPIVEDSVELTKDRVVLNIDVTITNNVSGEKNKVLVKYNYRKTFEKVLSKPSLG